MKPTERTADIIQRRTAGETLASIGRVHGISREYVRQVCKKAGVKSITPENRGEAALQLLLNGEVSSIRQALIRVKTGLPVLKKAADRQGCDLGVIQLNLAASSREKRTHKYDGRVWGMWTAIAGGYTYESPNQRWQLCRCECGVERNVSFGNLQSGVSRGCGCRSSNGRRERTPWVCSATGERIENTLALAKHLGINQMTLVRRLNRGESYTDANRQEWTPLPDEAVEHLPGRDYFGPHIPRNGKTIVCVETGETWPSIVATAEFLDVSKSTLRDHLERNSSFACKGHTYRKEVA